VTTKWISMKLQKPPVGKPVLCYFITMKETMAGTMAEFPEIIYGAYDGKNRFRERADMGKYIRGYASFSEDYVTYWADVAPIQIKKDK